MANGFASSLMKGFRNLHVFMYRSSGGKLGGSINGSPLLLLTVTGRKSGREFTMPLAYILHEGEYLVAGSAAGAEKDPVWVANLDNRPDAKIFINGTTYRVHATKTTGEERDRLYALFKAQGKNFVEYETKTTRKIPVFRLKPVTSG